MKRFLSLLGVALAAASSALALEVQIVSPTPDQAAVYGQIRRLVVLDGGSGYDTTPAQLGVEIIGSGAFATADVASVTTAGTVTGLTLTNPGIGYEYDNLPIVTVYNRSGAAPTTPALIGVELAQAFQLSARVTGPTADNVANVVFRVNGTVIGNVGVSPSASDLWVANFVSDRPGVYTIQATVTDVFGNVAVSPSVQYRIGGIALTEPRSNQLLSGGSAIPLSALALAASTHEGATIVNLDNGLISNVLFEVGDSVVGPWTTVANDTVPPYGAFYTAPLVGASTQVFFRATYKTTDGSSRTSSVQSVQIVPPPAPPPLVSLIEPLDNSRTQGGAIVIRASATPQSGGANIRNVRFFANDTEIGTAATALPYQLLWTPTAAGSYAIRALVTDDLDNSVLTSSATISVSGGAATEPSPGVIVPSFTGTFPAKFSPGVAPPGMPDFVGGPDTQVLSLLLASESRGVATGSVVNSVWLVPEGKDITDLGTNGYLLGNLPFGSIPQGTTTAPTPFSVGGTFAVNVGASGQLNPSASNALRIPPGRYQIVVRFSTVLNRTESVGITELTALPDLRFNTSESPLLASPNSGLRFRPGTYRAGDYLPDLSVSVQNRGTWGTTQDWFIDVRLSTDAVFGNEDDFLLTRVAGPSLLVDNNNPASPDGKAVIRFNGGTGVNDRPLARLPGNLAGSYFVFATLNSTNSHPEIDTTNNVISDIATSNIVIEPSVFPLVTRASELSGSVNSNGVSDLPAVSGNGSFIAFLSAASNLGAPAGSVGTQVLVRSRDTNDIAAVSVSSSGAAANGRAYRPSLNGDGRYVVFASEATNLVSGDTNGLADLFLRDRDVSGSGTFDQPGNVSTTRISVSAAGTQANGATFRGVISANGRWVAFESQATNLVPGVTTSGSQIFVWDRLSGTVSLVSRNAAGVVANGASTGPAISADGRHIAFESVSTNLVSGDTNGVSDVFVVDRDADASGFYDVAGGSSIRRVSVAIDPVTGVETQLNRASTQASISNDGSQVAFASLATNAILAYARGSITFASLPSDADTLTVSDGTRSVTYEFDNNAAVTVPNVAVALAPTIGDTKDNLLAALQASVAAADLNLFVADASDQSSTRLGLANRVPGPSGDAALFSSNAAAVTVVGLSGGALGGNGYSNVFVHDRDAGDTGIFDSVAAGARSTLAVSVPDVRRDLLGAVGSEDVVATVSSTIISGTTPLSLGSLEPVISGDGRYVAYRSLAQNLGVNNSVANTSGIYVHDRLGLNNRNLSINRFGEEAGQNVATVSPSYTSQSPAISTDGRFIAYSSDAGNLVYGTSNLTPVDTNRLRDVFLADQRTTTALSDISITSVSYEPGVYQPGSTIALDITLRNSGSADVAASQEIPVTVWLTRNRWPAGAGDLVLSNAGLRLTGGLLSGQSRTLQATVTVPLSAAADRFYLAALVGRSNEDLDVVAPQLTYTGSLYVSANRNISTNTLPDFTFDSANPITVAAGRYAIGTNVPVEVRLLNLGIVSGQAVNVRVTFSPDATTTNPGAIIGLQTTLSGLTETARSFSLSVPLPSSAVVGTRYYVIAEVNTPADITESTSGNNTAATASAVVDAATNPDLGFLTPAISFDSNTSYSPGRSLPVTVRIGNLNSFRPGRDFVVTLVLLNPDGTENAETATNQTVSAYTADTIVLNYNLTIPASLAEGTYSVRARIDGDNQIAEVSKANNVAEVLNSLRITRSAPVVTLVLPAQASSVRVNSSIFLTAFATAENGVTGVEFFVNGARIGTDTEAPYTIVWRPLSAGSFQLTARATDRFGLTGTSPVVTLNAEAATSVPPTVTVQLPSSGQLYAGNPVTLSAIATDTDSAITSVEFFVGGRSLGADTSAPYSAAWIPDTAGAYEVRAVALDATGNYAVSPFVLATVGSGLTASVSLTASKTSATLGSTVQLTASAAPTELVLSGFEFFVNDVSFGVVDGALPQVTVDWTPTTNGTYAVRVEAIEVSGRRTASSEIQVSVGLPNLQVTAGDISFDSALTYAPGVTLPVTVTAQNEAGNLFRPLAAYNLSVALFDGLGNEITGTRQTIVVDSLDEQSVVHSFNVVIPSSLADDTYSLRATVDRAAAVVETNEADNTAASLASVRVSRTIPVVSVALASSAGGAQRTGSAVLLSANVTSSALIGKVEFFANGVLIGTADTTAPYLAVWTPGFVGDYAITARAYEVSPSNVVSVSQTLTVPVTAATSAPPSVTVQPPSASELFAGNPVTVTASATDADSAIASVEFFAGTRSLGSDTSAPYSVQWIADLPGVYELRAIATDTTGSASTSVVVPTTVAAPLTPSVALEVTSGSEISLGGSVSLVATLTPNQLNGVSAEFFANGVSIATVSQSGRVFNTTWQPTVAGVYNVAARIIEASGRVTLSPSAQVTVAKPDLEFGPAVPISFNSTLTYSQGSTVNVTVSGRFVGTFRPSSPFAIALAIVDGVGTPIAGTTQTVTITDLRTETYTASFAVTVPTTLADGSYGFRAILDVDGAVSESNESNNQAFTALSLGVSSSTPVVSLTLAGAAGGDLRVGSTQLLTAFPTVAIGQTVAVVRFYVNGVEVSEDTSAPYTTTWTPTAAGSVVLTARAVDSGNRTGVSADVSRTVVAATSAAPNVTLSPVSGAALVPGNALTVSAVVTDVDSSNVTVEFFAGLQSLGSDSTAPYSVDWTPTAAGTYELRAIAVDSTGSRNVSNALTVKIDPNSSGSAPTVSLSLLQSPASVPAQSTVGLQAFATSATSLRSVQFYVNDTLVAEDTTAPYIVAWTPIVVGSYRLQARATDSGGLIGLSTTVTLNVVAASSAAPSVTLQTPSSNQLFAGNAVSIGATVIDADSTVASVEFFAGARSLGVDASAPYGINWTPEAAGTYELRAIATDSTGSRGISLPTTLTVGGAAEPSLVIELSTSDIVPLGTEITVKTTLLPAVLTAQQLDLYASGVLIGSSTTPGQIYSFNWTPGISGTYELVAVSTEITGRKTTSDTVLVTVGRQSARVIPLTGVLQSATGAVNLHALLAGERLDIVAIPSSGRPFAVLGAPVNLAGQFDIASAFGTVSLGGGGGEFRSPQGIFILSPTAEVAVMGTMAGTYTGTTGSRTAVLTVSPGGKLVGYVDGSSPVAFTHLVLGSGPFSGTTFSGNLGTGGTATLTVGSGNSAVTFNLTRVAPAAVPVSGALYLKQIERR